MATSNFKVFNENFNNSETDSQYDVDAQRIGGVVPGVAPSALHNKLYRQVSIMAAAIGQLSANRGYNASDADLTALVQSLNGALGPAQSLADTTYYVSPTGNDSNNGTSAGTPFKTIAKAISMIPQVNNHTYTINLAAGTYNEDVSISGIGGSGFVQFQGVSGSIIKSFTAARCSRIVVSTITANTTTATGFRAYDGGIVDFISCIVSGATGTYSGFDVTQQFGNITTCTASNRAVGIFSTGGRISAVNCSGTGNNTAYQAQNGADIRYAGTQVNGTTQFGTATGGTIAAVVPQATGGSLTYYVSTTGNDSNDGATAGTALRNIQTAINRIPQIVNHTVTINVADGTYNENLNFLGFVGWGSISLVGNTGTPANCSVASVTVSKCVAYVSVSGFNATSTTAHTFVSTRSVGVLFTLCRSVVAASSFIGFYFEYSNGRVTNSTASNRNYGIMADFTSTLNSESNTGTGNNVGLQCGGGSTIGKFGTQPGGTTAEGTVSGGVIR